MPNEYKEKGLNKTSHLFDGKDIEIENVRNNDDLRRRTRSEKTHAIACRTMNMTTPMGLAFDHTRAIGARGSEKKIMEWWGSSTPYCMQCTLQNHLQNFYL